MDPAPPSWPPFELGADAFDPAFLRAHRDGTAAAWDDVVEEVGEDVWTLPLLTPAACTRLLAEVDRRAAARPATAPPNSMHGYGAVLEDLALGAVLEALHARWLQPFVDRRFVRYGADTLDGVHGFLAEYGADHDDELGFHVDDSAFTLNVCLAVEGRGSELYFGGHRCDLHQQSWERPGETFEVVHEPGVAVLHAGRHRHGVHPLLSGRRRNLIVWYQSSTAREAARTCPSWCAEHRPPTP